MREPRNTKMKKSDSAGKKPLPVFSPDGTSGVPSISEATMGAQVPTLEPTPEGQGPRQKTARPRANKAKPTDSAPSLADVALVAPAFFPETAQSLSETTTGPLPDYLRDTTPPTATHGTLEYMPRTKTWVVRGEVEVLSLCKRLFPGCQSRGKQGVRIAASRRATGDLNWLMMRYPLEILSSAKWQASLEQARHLAAMCRLQQQSPLLAQTLPSDFSGQLMSFQQEGVGYLMRMNRALLADEMGLGKTVQALAYLSLRRQWPVLIVVPPHLCSNWVRETLQFLRIEGEAPTIHVLKGLTPYPLPQAHVYIVHYLLLRGWKKNLRALEFDTVVLDEMQELRHRGTEKYAAAVALCDAAGSVVGLSGTPIYNRGGEIYNVINILESNALGDAETFARQWCDPYTNTVMDPVELGRVLRAQGLFLRRTKEQVLPQLPPKRRLVQEIDADNNVYAALLAAMRTKVQQWQDSDNASEKALLLEQVSQAERQATGVAKAPHVAAFVAALLEDGERVLLFAHHHRVIDVYARELAAFHPKFITGRETANAKDKALEAFMSGQTRLCVVSLRAASGLNLQAATCVVFGELDWSPAVHTQAEDRAHRIGTTDSILCYYLVSAGGSDRDMQEILGLKVSQFTQLMGDRIPSQAEVEQAQIAATNRVMALVRAMNALPDVKTSEVF